MNSLASYGRGPLAALLAAGFTVVVVGCGPAGDDYTADPTNVTALRSEMEKGLEAGDDDDQELAEPTGFATLRGRFVINGAAPAPTQLEIIGDDRAYCTQGPVEHVKRAVVVGEDNGIADVVIWISSDIPDDPKWISPDLPELPEEVEFDQEDCEFVTHVFLARASQTIKVLNSDTIGHNTNIQPNGAAAAFNQTIPAGGYANYLPGGAAKTPFNVSCSIHPWMSAYMFTRNNPYFVKTNERGEFELPQVPAGVELEFSVWQSGAGFVSDVTIDGQQTSWRRGRFTMTLEPDEERSMDVVVDASVFGG